MDAAQHARAVITKHDRSAVNDSDIGLHALWGQAAPELGSRVVVDPIQAELDDLGLAYTIIDCDPALADTAEFCAAYGYDPNDSANAIVVIGKAEPAPMAMCLLLASTRLDVNRTVRKRLGTRKASFATADQTIEATNMMIGGVTPFGLPTPLPIWIDAAVMERSALIIGGGTRDRKLLVPPATLAAHPRAEIVDGLATAM